MANLFTFREEDETHYSKRKSGSDTLLDSKLINTLNWTRSLKRPNCASKEQSPDSREDDITKKNPSASTSIGGSSSILNVPDCFKRTCGWSSILIVDDSPFNILILQEILNKIIPLKMSKEFASEGKPYLGIDEASNGKHALNKVKDTLKKKWCSGYELILMDLNMPVMDGATSTKHIVELQKASMLSPTLKIVALTAYDSPEHKKLWKESGMKGFMNKPVSLNDVISIIENH